MGGTVLHGSLFFLNQHTSNRLTYKILDPMIAMELEFGKFYKAFHDINIIIMQFKIQYQMSESISYARV